MKENKQEIKHQILVLKNCKLSTFIKMMFKKNISWRECKFIDGKKRKFWTSGRKW